MKENFLVINFLDDNLEINAVKADFGNKNVKVLWSKNGKDASLDKLRKIFQTAFPFGAYRIILALDSDQAFTNYETFFLRRDNPKDNIDEADLENIISQGLWKLFDEGRAIAVKRLKLNDLEILLADVWVHDFKIDNRRVLDPLKHRGSEIEICLSQTFANRSAVRQISDALPKRAKISFITEGGVAAAHLISRFSRKNNFIFAKVFDEKTGFFSAGRDGGVKIRFLDKISWGKNDFYGAISRDLDISRDVSEKTMEKFITGATSVGFEKKFSRVFTKEAMVLIKGIRLYLKRAKKSFAYFDFDPLIPSRFFPKIIEPISGGKITEVFGFDNINKMDFLSLSSLIEFYFLPKEDLVNHLAKRRMRWLTP